MPVEKFNYTRQSCFCKYVVFMNGYLSHLFSSTWL